jgi:fibro-slime domain-containing protein
MRRAIPAIVSAAVLVACGSDSATEVSPGGSGPLGSTSADGMTDTEADTSAGLPKLDVGSAPMTTGSAESGGDNCGNILTATVRDFSSDHPDFEYVIQDDRGLVADQLGADGKPVYTGDPTTPTTNGQEFFDQWYRDVDGVNVPFEIDLVLVDNGDGTWTYDNSEFFPLDDMGFGNEGRSHNYHFTLELHSEFTYEGGEVFSFTGDDDLFTFINGTLVMDLGGVHGPQNASVDLDQVAAELGLEPGQSYPIDFFFAERHTSMSNFRIDTTIGCFVPGVPPG